jgi:predicted phosphodiesterase
MAQTWSKEKIELLKAYLQGGLSTKDIAIKLKSTSDAVGNAIRRYDLKKFKKQEELPVLDLAELDDANFAEQKEAAKLQWQIAKSKVPANPKNKFKTYLIVGDIHVPKHNADTLKSVFKLMDDVKFDGLINIGDFLDLGCISHHNKGKHKTLEGARLKNDFIIGNSILDEFDKRLPVNAEKYFLEGNHEKWLDMLIDEIPALDGLFDINSGLKLIERGYKVSPYNEILKFGKLRITHGIYTGSNPAKTHATKTLSNILVGHLHSPELSLIHSPAKEISVVGYVNGCLCDMSPDYMKNKPSNWAHGISVLYLFPDGQFDVNLIRIVKNKFVFNGKVYDGNK